MLGCRTPSQANGASQQAKGMKVKTSFYCFRWAMAGSIQTQRRALQPAGKRCTDSEHRFRPFEAGVRLLQFPSGEQQEGLSAFPTAVPWCPLLNLLAQSPALRLRCKGCELLTRQAPAKHRKLRPGHKTTMGFIASKAAEDSTLVAEMPHATILASTSAPQDLPTNVESEVLFQGQAA
jgi:hypothetical protein